MKPRTHAQAERQKARSVKNGKYVRLNPCEACGKSAGTNYWSHPKCNQWGYALVLCRACGLATDEMDEAEFRAYAKKRNND